MPKPKRRKKVLRCYFCGKDVLNEFTLLTMKSGTDRVFIAHNDCSKQADDTTIIISVKEV